MIISIKSLKKKKIKIIKLKNKQYVFDEDSKNIVEIWLQAEWNYLTQRKKLDNNKSKILDIYYVLII